MPIDLPLVTPEDARFRRTRGDFLEAERRRRTRPRETPRRPLYPGGKSREIARVLRVVRERTQLLCRNARVGGPRLTDGLWSKTVGGKDGKTAERAVRLAQVHAVAFRK